MTLDDFDQYNIFLVGGEGATTSNRKGEVNANTPLATDGFLTAFCCSWYPFVPAFLEFNSSVALLPFIVTGCCFAPSAFIFSRLRASSVALAFCSISN